MRTTRGSEESQERRVKREFFAENQHEPIISTLPRDILSLRFF